MADLTTLARVKEWVGVPSNNTTDDALLTRLISAASRTILAYIGRPMIFKKSYTRKFSGVGNPTMVIPDFPVQAISSLKVNGVTIPQAETTTSSGWAFEEWSGYCPGQSQLLALRGYNFTTGMMNVELAYTSGYYIGNEAHTVPAASTYTVTVDAPQGKWAVDEGVTLANGTALTKVASAPAALQYSVADGVYTFNAAQASAAVLISYSFTPADLENVCIEMVAERYRYKDRIGLASKSLAGQETISYSLKDLNAFNRMQLDPYKRVVL